MKIKVLLVAICIGCMLACTQKTCPTYTKDDVKKTENAEKDS